MGNIPSGVLQIFASHLVLGIGCLYFGLRTRRSFKWILLLVGGLEVVIIPIFFFIALNQYATHQR